MPWSPIEIQRRQALGLVETAKAVVKRANELGGRKYAIPEIDIKSLPIADLAVERVGFNNKRILLKEPDTRSTLIGGCVVVYAAACRAPTVELDCHDRRRFHWSDDDNDSLLIVRGNVGRVNGVRNSILIATGNFQGDGLR